MGELALVAHHRPGGVVELQVAAAGIVEGAHRRAISVSHVLEISFEIRIGFFADGTPALAEVQHAGRRNGHLRRDARVLLDEPEIVDMVVVGITDAADHAHTLGLGLYAVK